MQRKSQPRRESEAGIVDRLGQLVMADREFYLLFQEFHHVDRQIRLARAQGDSSVLPFAEELERLRDRLAAQILEKFSFVLKDREVH